LHISTAYLGYGYRTRCSDKRAAAGVKDSRGIFLAFANLGSTYVYPPQSLKAEVLKSQFVLQTDITHSLSWTRSVSANVAGYEIRRNGEKISVVKDLFYIDHNRAPNEIDLYEVRAMDDSGNLSAAISAYNP
jgi:hypothetical protein